MVPVAILGAVLILLGIVLTIDWSDDEPPVPITGTTTTLTASTVTGG